MGFFFLKKTSSGPLHGAGGRPSLEWTGLFGLACHESPFPSPPSPVLQGARTTPPPPPPRSHADSSTLRKGDSGPAPSLSHMALAAGDAAVSLAHARPYAPMSPPDCPPLPTPLSLGCPDPAGEYGKSCATAPRGRGGGAGGADGCGERRGGGREDRGGGIGEER